MISNDAPDEYLLVRIGGAGSSTRFLGGEERLRRVSNCSSESRWSRPNWSTRRRLSCFESRRRD